MQPTLHAISFGRQNAAHAAMAGFTACSVGLCNNRIVLLPMEELCAASPRNLNPYGRSVPPGQRTSCIPQRQQRSLRLGGVPGAQDMGAGDGRDQAGEHSAAPPMTQQHRKERQASSL